MRSAIAHRRVGITPLRVLTTVAIFGALVGCFMPRQNTGGGYSMQTLRSTAPWSLDPLALPPLAEDAAQIREAEAGASAVVLLDERTLTHVVDPDGIEAPYSVLEVRRALRLDHRSAVERAQVRIDLDADDRLLGALAETRTADGRVVPVGEARGFDQARYPDTPPRRAVVFAFPYAEPGAIVRWAYRIRTSGLTPLDVYRTPSVVPVRRAVYRLETYDFVEVDSQAHGMTASRDIDLDRQRALIWTVDGLGFEPPDPGEAPHPSGRASVRMAVRTVMGNAFVQGWTQILEPLVQRQLDLMPRLPASWPDDPPKGHPLVAAVDLVQRDLAEGVTPLAPSRDDPEALHRFRRATPHDKAGLVYALVTRWEADCHLWATNGPHATPISADFPMPIDDLRMLVQCGRRIYDPGCEGCAVGGLSEAVRGRFAISLGLDERERLTFEFRALPHRSTPPVERGYALDITDRGLVAETGGVVLHGVHADRVRRWLREHPLPPDEAAEAAATEFLDGVEAGRVEVSGHDRPGKPVRFDLHKVLLARGGFTHGAGWAIVSLDRLFVEPALGLAAVKQRTRPMVLASDMGFVNTLRLPPAKGWSVVERPAPTVIESNFGDYRLTHPDGEQTTIVETLTLTPGVIEPDEWPALRDFLERVAAHRRGPTTLRRTP